MAAAGLLLMLLLFMSSDGGQPGSGGFRPWEPRSLWGGARLVQAAEEGGSLAFLGAQLPLKPLIATPVSLLANLSTPVEVAGQQALTVVFSRPVVPLGGDFGTSAPWAGKVPFNLTCATSSVPASKARWVTTTIARFDPDSDWPTDLDCTFVFNQDLVAYDGAKIQLSNLVGARRLVSTPLSAWLAGVWSPRAANATGGSWTPTVSARPGTDDALPEVPPDGVVTINFNFPVNRTLLARSLELKPNPDKLKLNVSRCMSAWPWAGASPSSLEADARDEACVAVSFSGALRDETRFKLVLPAGARYSDVAGVTRKALPIVFTGLRAFQIPIRQDFQQPTNASEFIYDGTKYKRLVLWLPHGLAKGVTAERLAQQVTICAVQGTTCFVLALSGAELVRPSHLQLQVDALEPRRKYRASVAASRNVRDAFGKPLKASTGYFWTTEPVPFFSLPGGVTPVAHFSPQAWPSQWPIEALGADSHATQAAVWIVDASTEKGRNSLVTAALLAGSVLVDKLLGRPEAQVRADKGTWPMHLSLPLDAAQDAQLVATCCQLGAAPSQQTSSSVQLVLKSSLLATWVVAPGRQVVVWVTSADPQCPGPVKGAYAYLYKHAYDQIHAVDSVSLLGSCTTDHQGACTLPMPAANAYNSFNLAGLVRGPGGQGGLVFTPSVGDWSVPSVPTYTGTLALDRALLRPGDSLHVTGFIGQKNEAMGAATSGWPVGVPNVTKAVVMVTPSWHDNSSYSTLTVPITPSYGTLHATIPVPATANPGVFTVSLFISPLDNLPDLNGTASTSSGVSSGGSAGGAAVMHKPSTGRHRRLQGHAAQAWTVSHPSHGSAAGVLKQLAAAGVADDPHAEAGSWNKWIHGQKSGWRRELMQATADGASTTIDTDSWMSVAAGAVTVSDPRPPTADLSISAPAWAAPNAAVNVSLVATSYLGSQVSNASVTLVWSTYTAQGLVVAATDAQGAATAVIPLDTLPPANISAPGSNLTLTAEWVGPTRERIVRTASVVLDTANRRLSLAPTLATNVPGLTWGVLAELTSNVDGSSIKGVKVRVTLKPNKTAGAECSTSLSCVVLSGDVASGVQCQLRLPCVGPFTLRACTVDGAACSANITLGLNRTQWALAPYSRFNEPQLLLDKDQYELGETATLWFQNAWSSRASAYVLWGNQEVFALRNMSLGPLPVGPVKVELPLGPECRGGCAAAVLLAVPQGAGVLDSLPGMTISKLFDPLGAHTHALTTTLIIATPDGLDVSILFGSNATTTVNGAALPVLAPGANTTVTVRVTDKGAPVEDAEITLLAVDKSLLDLLPYPLQSLPPALALYLAGSLSAAEADTTRVAPQALQLVFETLKRRLNRDPWLPADVDIVPPAVGSQPWLPTSFQWLSAVDQPDELYLEQFTSTLTYGPGKEDVLCDLSGACRDGSQMPSTPGREDHSDAAASPSSSFPPKGSQKRPSTDHNSAGGSSGGSTTSPRLTSQFVSTPLFTVLRTATDGAGAASFTAPSNLGTFVFRAFVVTKGVSRLGSNESSLVVRRPLSLSTSLPRIVRVGDEFLAGVLVTSPGLEAGTAPFTVTVKVKVLAGPLKLLSTSATARATLSGARNQAEVRFNFSALALDDALLEFAVSDVSGASDALVAPLPVLAQQSSVFVATSFALRAFNGSSVSNSTTGWQEGLALPEAVPGSGSLDLLAGVGYLPAILASTNAVAARRATLKVKSSDIDASTSLALAAVAPLLSAYGQKLSTPQQGNATDALQALGSFLTDSRLGLLPYRPGLWSWNPTRADVVLNCQGAWLVSGLSYKKGPLKKAWGSLYSSQVPVWQEAAARQLVQDATDARSPRWDGKPQPYQDWFTLAWVRLALGYDWYLPLCGTPEASAAKNICTYDENVRADVALSRLVAAASSASLDVKLLTALAVFNSSSTSHVALVRQAAAAAVSSMRMQGRTAYVASYPGAHGAASLDTQALALRLLAALRRPSDAPLVQKLAAYLAASGSTSSGALGGLLPPPTQSAWVTAVVASTLAQYDKLVGSTTPDLTLEAVVNSAMLLKATFNKSTAGAPPACSSTPWEELASPPGSLTLNTTGRGEVSVSVSLSFVPLKPLPFPTYQGIWVMATIQLTDPLSGAPTGPPLSQAPLGSVLTVTVQVTTPDDLSAVTIEALSAGGLEPLDPVLTSGQGTVESGAQCPMATWAGDAYSRVFWWWWWPICPTQAVTPESVTWRYQRLVAGTQMLTYSALAATQGTFMLPPIKASADDQPEVSGMTASGLFTVGPAGSSPVPLSGAEGGTPAARACPSDCSGNGACNMGSGQCVCTGGWSGGACDQPTSVGNPGDMLGK